MASGALPVLASVIVCAGLVGETPRGANTSDGGVIETMGAGATPVPDNGTLCGLPAALVVSVSALVRVPLPEGVNVTFIVQLAPAASGEEQSDTLNSGPIATDEIVSDALPVLVSVTACAGLVVPIVCEP